MSQLKGERYSFIASLSFIQTNGKMKACNEMEFEGTVEHFIEIQRGNYLLTRENEIPVTHGPQLSINILKKCN